MNNDDNKFTSQQDPTQNADSENKTPVENNIESSVKPSTKNNEQQENTVQDETNTHSQSTKSESTQQQYTDNSEELNEPMSDTDTEKTWHNKNAIKRGIAMLGYGFVAGFVRLGITLIAVFQFFSLLLSEKPNLPLVKFGQNLNTYQYQINQFLTVNSEVYPFPFADWPDCGVEESTPK